MTCCGLDATTRRARRILRTAPALILAAGLLATSASGAVARGGKPDTPPGKAAAPARVETPASAASASAPAAVLEPAAAPAGKKAKKAKNGAKQKPAKSGKKPK